MYSFPELIKKIRTAAGLTQAEFAKELEVSPVLIAMVESGQKPVSKNLLIKLAKRLDVHPSSITPFLYSTETTSNQLSGVEKKFMAIGAKLQEHLIKDRSKLLRKNDE
jgi:transcriptional regulator with XRE-family HTH domain